MRSPLPTVLLVSLMCFANTVFAAERDMRHAPEVTDVLNLDTTVGKEITPDLAVMVLAIDREGADSAVLSREVNDILARALAQAKAAPGIVAASGGYNSFPRQDSKGKRVGWQLHAEIVLKSRDFGALGQLAGKLASEMVVTGSNFEISPELRAAEESGLIERGVQAFRAKAMTAAQAFGYGGYRIREIHLGSAGQQPGPRPLAMRSMAREAGDSAGIPLESPRVSLNLSVSGAVQLLR